MAAVATRHRRRRYAAAAAPGQNEQQRAAGQPHVTAADHLKGLGHGPYDPRRCCRRHALARRRPTWRATRQRAAGVPRGDATIAKPLRCKAGGGGPRVGGPARPAACARHAGRARPDTLAAAASGGVDRQTASRAQMNHPIALILDPVPMGAATWACGGRGRTTHDVWKLRVQCVLGYMSGSSEEVAQ